MGWGCVSTAVVLRTSPQFTFYAPVPWYMLLCATMVSWSGGVEVEGTSNFWAKREEGGVGGETPGDQ